MIFCSVYLHMIYYGSPIDPTCIALLSGLLLFVGPFCVIDFGIDVRQSLPMR